MYNKINRVWIYRGLYLMSVLFTSNAVAYERFHADGIVSQPIKDICSRLGATVETLEQANAFGQEHLLRTGERWDSQAARSLECTMREHENFLKEKLDSLGLIDAVILEGKEHVYALLMGGLRERVKVRFAHLKSLLENGYHFKYIVLLGGMRSLNADEKEGLPAHITTEAEMMKYEYKQIPALQGTPMILVNAPMIEKADGTRMRPTTDSTLVHFMKIAPIEGSCVVISNNPYTERQKKVAERILDQKRFPVYAAGAKANPNDTIAILMDEFARSLYEENTRFKRVQI